MVDAPTAYPILVVMVELLLLLSEQDGFKDALVQAGALTTTSQLIAHQNLCDGLCLRALEFVGILVGKCVVDTKHMHTSQGRWRHQPCQKSYLVAAVPPSDLTKCGNADRSSCTSTGAISTSPKPQNHQQRLEFHGLHSSNDAHLGTVGRVFDARTQDTSAAELNTCHPRPARDHQQRPPSTVLLSDSSPVYSCPESEDLANKAGKTSTAFPSDTDEPELGSMQLSRPPHGLPAACPQQEEQCSGQVRIAEDLLEVDAAISPEAEERACEKLHQGGVLSELPPSDEPPQTCEESVGLCDSGSASPPVPEQSESCSEGGECREEDCTLPLGPMLPALQGQAVQTDSGLNNPTYDTPQGVDHEGLQRVMADPLRNNGYSAVSLSGYTTTASNLPHRGGVACPVHVPWALENNQRIPNERAAISRGMANAVAEALNARLREGLQLPRGRLAGQARNMAMHALCGLAEHDHGRQGLFLRPATVCWFVVCIAS